MKMVITVEIKNADGTEEVRPIVVDTEIPNFEEFTGPDNFREVFDRCEKAALKIRNEAVELAIKEYLTEISKKLEAKIEGQEGLTIREESFGYKIEAEIGRLDIVTHRAEKGSRVVYNTKVAIFPKTGPKEVYRTAYYDALLLQLATHVPYRQTEEILNHLRWQDEEDKVRSRTLADAVVREGAAIVNYISGQAQQILTQNHFDPETGKPQADHPLANRECSEIPSIPATKVGEVIEEYNASREKEHQIDVHQIAELFEDPSECVNVAVDEVGVTEQKASGRSKNSPPKESKHYVRNTVIHIQQGVGKYILDGLGIRKTLVILQAFLLHNDLQDKMIVFFTDGADDIKNAIKEIYGQRSFRIILDWYHLTKKCKERLSMGLKGREVRNEVLKTLLALLWLGKVDAAIQYLEHLEVRYETPVKSRN